MPIYGEVQCCVSTEWLKIWQNQKTCVFFWILYFFCRGAISVPRRLESLASTEPGMVLLSVRPWRRWRSPSTPSMCAPSAERRTWSARLLASGSAAQRTAASRLPVAHGTTPPPLQPPSGLLWGSWRRWRSCKQSAFLYYCQCQVPLLNQLHNSAWQPRSRHCVNQPYGCHLQQRPSWPTGAL